MKLALVKTDGIEDWYTIERAEHSSEYGMKPTKYGFALTYAGRISNADVEGTAAEMLSIAEAIEKRSEAWHKRCAVIVEEQSVRFNSPRNSTIDGVVSLAEADELAAEIRAKLGGAK